MEQPISWLTDSISFEEVFLRPGKRIVIIRGRGDAIPESSISSHRISRTYFF
jgi:hypothetical protein